MSDLRTAFGNTRKHAFPLVAVLDGQGMTRRRGTSASPAPVCRAAGGAGAELGP